MRVRGPRRTNDSPMVMQLVNGKVMFVTLCLIPKLVRLTTALYYSINTIFPFPSL